MGPDDTSDEEDWMPYSHMDQQLISIKLPGSQEVFSEDTAFPPTKQELRAAERLDDLNIRVESLELELKEARRSRRKQNNLLFSMRAKRAPIARLPDDVLLHIFTVCLAPEQPLALNFRRAPHPCTAHPTWYHRSILVNLPLPVILSHICKRWRKLVLGTGAFWANMKMDRAPPVGHIQFETYLSRSGNALLNVVIRRPDVLLWGDVHNPADRCPRLFRLFRRVAHRLVSLSIDSCEHTCNEVFLEFHDRMPRLRCLSLQTSRCNKGSVLPPSEPKKVFLPSLQSAALNGTLLGLDLFRLAHIKELRIDLEDMPFTSALSALHSLWQCVDLQKLYLHHFYFKNPPPELSTFELHLPQLRLLEIGHDHAAVPLPWLARMELPSLTRLSLGYMRRRRTWLDAPDLSAPFRPEDRERCFQLHAGITSLNVTFEGGACGPGTDTPDVLYTVQLLRDGALPRLQDLTIQPDGEMARRGRCHSSSRRFRRSVADMIHTRFVQGIPLRTLRVDPPLVSGEAWCINYASDHARKLREASVSEVDDMGLDGLFGEQDDRAIHSCNLKE
ncbi:hypothetical protein CALCODRAFT_492231 [Calocera cornea HHB12733]|uniref:F-box domain-containing protein n=1 Tax=Calocera cornea HHB12733 TaxID=1353952 RepID=A0A165IK44_9BASI|nr:hypothetical protein CALCODRAFT_492231 [Calocera cornea HHB12733]